MNEAVLDAIRDLIQEDVANRGLRSDPQENLITACPFDFQRACRSVAETAKAAVAIVTGFYIPDAQPPRGETDGPLGAIFLARALTALGIRVSIACEHFTGNALDVGLRFCGLNQSVPVYAQLPSAHPITLEPRLYWEAMLQGDFPLTHMIALERVGPSHTPESVRRQAGASAETVKQFEKQVAPEHYDRCHTMRGLDITNMMSSAHLLIETAAKQTRPVMTIGIGDGGNEIGMGKIPWDVIRRNIPRGDVVACRVPTDFLIVCGVSNWGAYGLATGIRLLRGQPPDAELYDVDRERELLRVMVERGPLVDGNTGRPTVSVDGLAFERYAEPLVQMARLCRSGS